MHQNLVLSLAGLLAIVVSSTNAHAQEGTCETVPDVVFYNGTVLTMDDGEPQAEAMATKADTIIAVGSSDDMLALLSSGCSTQTVDLEGRTMLPGFNESHGHWFSWREHICSVSEETTYPELEEIMGMLSENGWTSFSELNFGRPDFAPEHLDNALALDSLGKLSVRVNGYWGSLNDDSSLIDALAAAGRTPDTYYSDRVRAPGVKIYVDNPFGAVDILSKEEVENAVQQAAAAGWQVAAHAVNQSAIEKILTAYENVLGGDSNDGRRFRIEH
ncbi:MAG: amidohydrolase family protein, partial [Rhodothermales bacterium]